ncbi:RDD family protein [Rubrivirga sp. IMCC43871]|uniref:RDD family protein n=1 Tax=Rubrivirga sp. IMCC43871 TaxID=3391575 RepID=UPI00398FE994
MSQGVVLDPRDRITPTAFEIAPDLLGVALASPVRRGLALGADLVLAMVVSEAGGPAAAGIAAAVLFVLVGMRRKSGGRFRRVVRGALVGIGALILFGVTTGLLDEANDEEEGRSADVAEIPRPDPVAARAWSDSARAAAAADVRAFAAAFAAADSVAVDSLRHTAADAVAGRELRQRDADLGYWRVRFDRADDRAEDLQAAIDDPTFLRSLQTLAADFGLTLGWIGAYFTLTLAFWNGYTPGKRLLGVRVVRLDGRRVSLWAAFERFGGYIAGLVTGLLGFAQVLWDPNRQGVQDKIAGTAVVRMADARTSQRVG